MITVAMATLGCKVNQYETAAMFSAFQNVSLVPFHHRADCYIINTCTVTGRTDYQSRQMIRRACRLNPDAVIIVTGCYAQIASEKIHGIPGVTLIAGNQEKDLIPSLIQDLQKRVKGDPQVMVRPIRTRKRISPMESSVFPGHTRAFLKIQDGCDAFCSYCIVPYARGPNRSLPESEVMARLARLATHHREVVLTGIHLGAYGQDLNPPSSLLQIMRQAEGERIVPRLRLSSIEPREIPDDMIALMAQSESLCPHLHIPLQSGDPRILSAMGRDYDPEFFQRLIEKILITMPDAAIGVDVMAGFPGEDEDAFANTCRLIDALPIAYLHVFPFSKRPGTVAAQMPSQVGEDQKKRRSAILRDMGKKKRAEFAARFLGKKISVLVEKKRDRETDFFKGLSRHYVPVLIANGDRSNVNRIVDVVPESLQEGSLVGRITANISAAAGRS